MKNVCRYLVPHDNHYVCSGEFDVPMPSIRVSPEYCNMNYCYSYEPLEEDTDVSDTDDDQAA
jgi:hypothetical protein